MIIGISGRMGSGKNTVGDIIEKICLTNEGPLFEQKAFAGKLKQIGSILSGVPVEYFEDQDFKKLPMGIEWEMTYREFLQKLGTEAMRDGLHTNVWVNALFADYFCKDCGWEEEQKGTIDACSGKHELPNWIITDMRFPNELEAVKEKGGITIRVVRPHGYTNPHTGEYKEMPLSYHPSETALDDAKFDYEIINDGTIEDLIEKVKEILIKEQII
jgi:hypothetical protein